MNSKRPIDLVPDCAACASLCCVVFAFDKSESFAFDKAAGEVCRNLQHDGRCRVFTQRETLGLSGCVAYDCHGAGQRVTQEIFEGRSWRDEPALKQPMEAALSILRRVHEKLVLLQSAKNLPLSTEEQRRLVQLELELESGEAWTEAKLRHFPIDQVSSDVSAFLKSLRRHFPAGANGRI